MIAANLALDQQWWVIVINSIIAIVGIMLILDIADQAIKYKKACDHLANSINDLQKELYKKERNEKTNKAKDKK